MDQGPMNHIFTLFVNDLCLKEWKRFTKPMFDSLLLQWPARTEGAKI